ncbi:hypothetical protein AGABI1DRAFT_93078 [Agaricus bisporus var. burnettii JB137-S8]|uniref:Uncharacterized protein n=1 Tax=Agaricus bisporus var. burnettii (strain JB137-S8 / ATCC MYA-4627 / FGSC 10392) TaxID=597362 RepID=K5WQT1_AGABU|nr:uncharacterized protein AGABI1DRAFT_93078 [Agaricus bisporus var. burnettii JB137-S8]EKM77706.1 hypothetical protein AGABI1DRAFT_93078 [Agaricus bisporus var. burnettii JB137-S8]
MARTKGPCRKTTTSNHTHVRTIGHMQTMAGGRYNDHLRTMACETEEAEVEVMLSLLNEEEAEVVEELEEQDSRIDMGSRADEHHLASAGVTCLNCEEDEEDEEDEDVEDEDVEMEEDVSDIEETDEEEVKENDYGKSNTTGCPSLWGKEPLWKYWCCVSYLLRSNSINEDAVQDQWANLDYSMDVLADRSCPVSKGWPTEDTWTTGYVYPFDWYGFFPVIRMVGELDVSMSMVHPPGITNIEGFAEYHLILKEPVHHPAWIDLWRACAVRLKQLLNRHATHGHSDDYDDIMPDGIQTLNLRYPVYNPPNAVDHRPCSIPVTNVHGEAIGEPDTLSTFNTALMNFKFGVKHSPSNTKYRAEVRNMNVVAEM